MSFQGPTGHPSVAAAANAWLARYPAEPERKIPAWLDITNDRTFAVVLVLAALAGITLGLSVAALSVGYLPPCPTEDSTGCYWDAETMGNGTGVDVVTP